jgi:hypothetical protein
MSDFVRGFGLMVLALPAVSGALLLVAWVVMGFTLRVPDRRDLFFLGMIMGVSVLFVMLVTVSVFIVQRLK